MNTLFNLDEYTEQTEVQKISEWVIYYRYAGDDWYAWENKNRKSQYHNQWEFHPKYALDEKRRKARRWSRYQDAKRAADKLNGMRTAKGMKSSITVQVKEYNDAE